MLRNIIKICPFAFLGVIIAECCSNKMWLAFALAIISVILLLTRNVMEEMEKNKDQ